MFDGKHGECCCDARSETVTRRVAFLAAFFSVAALVPVSAISADALEVDEFLPVARYFPVQVTGPTGYTSPNNGVPWGLDRIDQRQTTRDQQYEYDQTGSGVTVYVADTGVQATHPDFIDGGTSRVQPGWSYRSDSLALAEYRYYRSQDALDACADTFTISSTQYDR